MRILISQQIEDLQAKIAEANDELAVLEGKLTAMDEGLSSLKGQQPRYQLLVEICTSLEKLDRMGANDLFREATGKDPEKQQRELREIVDAFLKKVSIAEKLRDDQQADIKNCQFSVKQLKLQLAERKRKAERLKNDPLHDMPYRVLPWSSHGADERRFRRILFTVVFFTLAFGGLIPYFRPPVEESKGVIVPERIARFIQKKQEVKEQNRLEQLAKKEEAEKKASEKSDEKPADKKVEKSPEKVAEKTPEKPVETPAEKTAAASPEKAVVPAEKVAEVLPKVAETAAQVSRRSAETKGVLAFKNDLASLLEDSSSPQMGADSKISVSAKQTTGDILQRSIIVSQSTGGSGGINTAEISRQSDGSGNKRIAETEIKFTHVESVASTRPSGADRPLSKGGGPSRTDEEIQIVFDQYKSALYRIYNKELRNNPTLRGKLVLHIVIEPDGRVSSCTVKSTDIGSPVLESGIVERVLKFNFGPKEGVPVITILYPIDFLPAS